MSHLLARLAQDESGATAVEYGLILALIFLAIIGAVNSFGQKSIEMWNYVSTTISSSTTATSA